MVEQHPELVRQARIAMRQPALHPSAARKFVQSARSPALNEAKAGLPADIAFLNELGFPARALGEIAQIAAAKHMAASEILMARGLITQDAYLFALARHVGVEFRAEGPDPRRVAAPQIGDPLTPSPALPVFEEGPNGRVIFAAPRGESVESTLALAARMPDAFSRVVFTTASALRKAAFVAKRQAIVAAATAHLRRSAPRFSAASRMPRRARLTLGGTCAIGIGLLTVDAAGAAMLAGAILSAFYTAAILLRALLIARLDHLPGIAGPLQIPRFTARHPEDLPVYSVLVALYREAGQVGALVSALEQLQWPRAKLEVFFVCEEDDPETVDALSALALPPGFAVVICPVSHPRTKPKALDFALPLCTGEYVVVYDAEDRPHPWQLREAFEQALRATWSACNRPWSFTTSARTG